MAESPRLLALLPCAGRGARVGTKLPKQYQPVGGQALVRHTLAALVAVRRLSRLLVVVAPGDTLLAGHDVGWQLADCGGATRAETVFNGLAYLRAGGASERDWVLVHDAARCLVTPTEIHALIDACLPDTVGGLLALPLADTLKIERDGRAAGTLERTGKWLAQTPQMFRLGELYAALSVHAATGFVGITDEASAMEAAGHRPLLVRGSAQNIKITYPEDFVLAEAILRGRLQ